MKQIVQSPKTFNQGKGQNTAVAAIVDAVRNGSESPFALESIVAVTRATIRARESAARSGTVSLGPSEAP